MVPPHVSPSALPGVTVGRTLWESLTLKDY